MITRYLKPIELSPIPSDAGTALIQMIVSAFVDIDVGFIEVTPTTSVSGAKAVQFENLKIDVFMSSSVIDFKFYLYYNEENYKTFTPIPSIPITAYTCNLSFFVSDDAKFIAVNIAGSEGIGKGSINAFYVITDGEEIVGLRKDTGTSDMEYYSTNQYPVKFSLKRTYPKEENVFFKDEGVPILKTIDSSFVMDMPYLVTLGGAEAQHTYTMTNGDNYYCLLDNIAVKFDTTVFPQTET